ncbi:hypothetical protein ABLG96_01215 [Nakamurella sp. A5-74]|uniref:Uncharacterized protein n=1 Tax=Nakamurella sp. A5-74 TaxID=3158264 RepID=A0AAU8DPT0_9ACTN
MKIVTRSGLVAGMAAILLSSSATTSFAAPEADDGTINTTTAQNTGTDGQSSSTVAATVYGKTPAERKAFAEAGGEKRPSSSGGRSQPSNCYYRASTDRLSLQAYNKSLVLQP